MEDTIPLFLGIPTSDDEPSDSSMPGAGEDDWSEDEMIDMSRSLIRPYMWTQGRTTSNYDLRLESLVSVDWDSIAMSRLDLGMEHRLIVELCVETRSVAEVAAQLAVPLGVARVLLSDLIGMGLVTLHNTTFTSDDQPEITLMERVLAGLKRL
jgi:hypothetical protein